MVIMMLYDKLDVNIWHIQTEMNNEISVPKLKIKSLG